MLRKLFALSALAAALLECEPEDAGSTFAMRVGGVCGESGSESTNEENGAKRWSDTGSGRHRLSPWVYYGRNHTTFGRLC